MSNDPKDAVVDLSKLATTQMQTSTIQIPTATPVSMPVSAGNLSNCASPRLLTSYNESANAMKLAISFGQDHNTQK